MLNRPPTKIELKLEDDLIDYEETVNLRKNIQNSNMSNLGSSSSRIFPVSTPNNLLIKFEDNTNHPNLNSFAQLINFNNNNNNNNISPGIRVSNNMNTNHNLFSGQSNLSNLSRGGQHNNLNITKLNIINKYISEEKDEGEVEEFNAGEGMVSVTNNLNKNLTNIKSPKTPGDNSETNGIIGDMSIMR